MKNIRRITALILCICISLGLAACSGQGSADEPIYLPDDRQAAAGTEELVRRSSNEIILGTYWTQHYDSNDSSLEDNPDYAVAVSDSKSSDPDVAAQGRINIDVMQLKFDNVMAIEDKFGVQFFWKNLTYPGIKESINSSIPLGVPDCDVYQTDVGIAIPAQISGYCIDLKNILPEDHDLFTDQIVMSYIDLGDGKACILHKQGGMDNTHPMAFNVQLLEEYRLEDPRDLWNRGEWTWDKFVEYAEILTQDTDGDGEIDQYGFGGFYPDLFEAMMLSNGASIATGPEQTLTSPEMTEVLQFIYDLYNTYRVCQPIDPEAEANTARVAYREGNIAFFRCDAWIQQENGSDYDWDGTLGYTLPFDIAYCHWPVGYSGNRYTDPQLNNVEGELYIIPQGVSDPEKVFNVLYDWLNWYDYDLAIRDNPGTYNWWIDVTGRTEEYRQANFKIQQEIYSKQTVDLWNSLGAEFDLWGLASGDCTPEDFQDTYAPVFQDALDNLYR